MRLFTVAEYKTLGEIQNSTQYDAMLTLIADGVAEDVEAFLNRQLEKKSRVQMFKGGSGYYQLPAFPVDLAQTFEVIEDEIALVRDQDYFVKAETGEIEFLYEITKRVPTPLKITWTGGYVASTVADYSGGPNVSVVSVPASIKMAAFIQANYLFRRRKSFGVEVGNLGASGGQLGGLTAIEGMRGLVPEAKAVLQRHRRFPSPL